MSENITGRIRKAALNVVKDSSGKVISFDIDRNFWSRGLGGSSLLDGDGQMCCLGFYGLACGMTFDSIESMAYPSSVKKKTPKQIGWLFEDSPFISDDEKKNQYALADINDRRDVKNYERERKIKRRFARNGIEVNFIN